MTDKPDLSKLLPRRPSFGCRIGVHQWTRWSEPWLLKFTTRYLNYTPTKRWKLVQSRVCQDCGKEQHRQSMTDGTGGGVHHSSVVDEQSLTERAPPTIKAKPS